MNSQVVYNMLSRSRQSVSVLSFFALPFNSANLIKFLVTIICLGGLFASPVKAAVKTYYAQENGSCGSSYGTGGNVWKPAAEGNSGSCTSRSTLGGRWDSGSARDMLIAYTPPYASQTTITGQAGSNIRFTETGRGGFTGRVRFVEINAAGTTILGNLTGEVTTSVPDSGSRNITDLSALSGTISAGNRLGMVVAITNADAEAFTYFGDNGGGSSNEAWFVVDEVSAGNAAPTLTVNEPNGAGDTVTQGASYNINYDLADSDDTVTVAFYYDTNNSGLDGTPISGACASAAEGTGATCSWDTTSIPTGSYYIYGITNDGSNPAVSAYSPGQITINSGGGGGGTPPTFDSMTTCATSSGSTQLITCSNHTTSSCSDRLMLVFAYYDGNEDISFGGGNSSIRIDPTGANIEVITGTSLEAYANGGTSNTNERVKVYSYVNPPSGTYDVNVNFNNNNNHYAASVVTLCGVDTTDPIGATGTNTGNGNSQTVNVTTTVADSLIVGGLSEKSGTSDPFTPTGGTVERWDFDTGAQDVTNDSASAGGEKSAPTAGVYSLDFTSSRSDNWAFAAVEVKAAPPPPNTPPTLTVNEPNGVSDTVTQGANYTINYDLADIDDTVTVAFYYDTNNSGLDGTVISGACASAAEGTGATCSWDTSGVTPGTYYVYGITDDGSNPAVNDYSPGQITINAPNSPPTLTVNDPDGVSDTVTQGANYSINYNLADSDDVVTVAFYYDTNNSGLDGTAISGACATASEGTGVSCSWNTTGVTPGTYYVYGITNDGTNPAVNDYSPGQITINAPNSPPTLTVNEPNGVSDTVTQGANYSINYNLADSDDVVTVAFFYDTNNTGLDGTAISGTCASAAEGTGATCSWDTTSVTPGTYYVYGITNDGTNPAVNDYSPGQITINAPNSSPTLTVNEPNGVGDTVTQGDNYSINYDLADAEDVVTVAFYYDTNNSGLDGTAISGACATAAEGTGAACSWDTTGVTPGTYYVYGVTNDGTNPAVSDYSAGQITINAAPNSPPSLTVNEPNGVDDTVTQGSNYSINYDLADSDDVVTVAFYYDPTNTGLDGIPIIGACASAAEGTGATCSWNTTGVTPGTYYIYGITSDGTNPEVNDYSPSTITINAAPIPLSYASGDDGTNPGGGDSIAGISRVGGGDDSNNLESNKWKINVEWEFRIDFFDDSGESPVLEPMLYIAHRNSPTTGAGGDFFVYPLDCTGVTWGNGKTCATTMKLGPAASHKFYFYAEKTDGTGVRIPSSGYTDGPVIQLIDGYSLVGAARDIDGSNHDGSAAFNSPYSYSWLSLGLDTSFGVTFNGNYQSLTNFGNPAETGRGYYSYKWANTLPELGANADVTAASHTITLQAGWNIISNPYNGNVKLNSVQIRQNGGTTDTWSNAAGSNWIEPAIYYYLGSDWGDSHTSEFGSDAELVPWMGYWIYVKDDINSYELIITKPAQ